MSRRKCELCGNGTIFRDANRARYLVLHLHKCEFTVMCGMHARNCLKGGDLVLRLDELPIEQLDP
jgi:hypothetical protein